MESTVDEHSPCHRRIRSLPNDENTRFSIHCCSCKFETRFTRPQPQTRYAASITTSLPVDSENKPLICSNRLCNHRHCSACIEDVHHLHISCWSCDKEELVMELLDPGSQQPVVAQPTAVGAAMQTNNPRARCRKCHIKLNMMACVTRWRSVYSTLTDVMGNTQGGLGRVLEKRGVNIGVYVRRVGERDLWSTWA